MRPKMNEILKVKRVEKVLPKYGKIEIRQPEQADVMRDLLLNTSAGRTRTENGAVTNRSTGSCVLDLYSRGASFRTRSTSEVANLIADAWREDQDLTLRTIFYLADVRGGQGERDLLFNALRYLAQVAPHITRKLFEFLPEYSRWDMMFAFIGTFLEKEALAFLKNQFLADEKSEYPTLLAKWLPSPGTKNKNGNKELCVLVARAFGMTLEDYRKRRAALNKRIKTVEIFMSARQWDEIDFTKVPAKAFMIYQKAFEKHGYEKMQKHVEKIASGEVKVKSDTLYPYDIMRKALRANGNEEITLQSAWDNLPNFLGENRRGLPIIDTSGSMTGLGGSREIEPILAAKAMGLYMSERLTGPYKDYYVTFSERPIMAKFSGATLAQKYRNMQEIVANTNIEAVFNLVLDVAVKNKLSQDQLPTHLYIFSDMQFDQCVVDNSAGRWRITSSSQLKTLFETMRDRYEANGYTLPQVIFWDLEARRNQSPVTQHQTGAAIVSGFSPAAFKFIAEGVVLTPYDVMMKTLNDPRYAILSKVFEE